MVEVICALGVPPIASSHKKSEAYNLFRHDEGVTLSIIQPAGDQLESMTCCS